jgi:hypothetical protein
MTQASPGWHISADGAEFSVAFHNGDRKPLFIISGFQTRLEAATFVAIYFVSMGNRQQTSADLGAMLKTLTMKTS